MSHIWLRPKRAGPYPGIVLIHSFNGLEQGYRTLTDQFAAEGFVVLTVGWQTFERDPSDATVEQLVRDSINFLTERNDVDADAFRADRLLRGRALHHAALAADRRLRRGRRLVRLPHCR